MTTRTIEDLATETMRMLGLLEAQEEASTEDAAHISRAYEDKFTEWFLREIAYWPVEAIPTEVFRAVARLMADEVAASFGAKAPTEMDENGQTISMGVKGMRTLNRVNTRRRSGLPTAATFF